MKHEISILIRAAVPVCALFLLMQLPVTDKFIGGNPVTDPVPVYSRIGDADGSGFVDLADVDEIRTLAAGETQPEGDRLRVSDLDADGTVTEQDAGILLLFLSDANAPDVTPDVYYRIRMNQTGGAA